jgi:hypothetical protein
MIDTTFKFVNNFDDMAAHLAKEGQPKFFCGDFFRPSKNGPHTSLQYFAGASGSKHFKAYAATIETKYKQDKAKLKQGSAFDTAVDKKLETMRKAESSARMTKARVAAVANAKRREDACVVTITS